MRISDWSSDVCSSDLVDQRVGALVEMDAGFGAMHDDVAAGDAAPVLGAATAVTAEPAAGAAAAEGEADAPLAAVAQLAAHQVLFEDVVLAGSFEEDRKSTRLNSSH